MVVHERAPSATPRLDQRYSLLEGSVLLSGVQALVRLPLDHHRRDVAAGLRTRSFISGFPGSPLGGYDLALQHARAFLDEHGVVHVPGQNEELAATALMGTQMLDDHPHADVDGVIGFWYGKGPGVDRSGDALKHGNFAGTSTHGAVVILSGEDHEAKSSTVPFQQEYAFQSAGIPILYPSSVAEFLTFGLHAVALSRFSGCWVALKLVNALCDGGEVVAVSPHDPRIVIPELLIDGKPFVKHTDFRFFPGLNVATERQLYRERHAAARAYARANGLDEIVSRSDGDRIGIITAGKSFADTLQALDDLGLDAGARRSFGLRVLRMGMIFPTDDALIRSFAEGLDEVIVVEEKRDFLETRVRAALCGLERGVRVVGKDDDRGEPLFPVEGGMDADIVAQLLAKRFARLAPGRGFARTTELAAIGERRYPVNAKRTPNYCSGCPHNTSTQHLASDVTWGSPGCHSFASIIEQPERHIDVMTQLGGEGMPWIGLAPFTERRHVSQNVGDGSLFHSSYNNIRFAVAAKSDITFRILYNGAVANTGAQPAVGGKTVPELARLLAIEGVAAIAIVTKDRVQYADAELPPQARVHDADELRPVMEDFAQRRGVTVLIYDDSCANERRRRRKRGTLKAAETYVVVNEDVCENCGDCGAKTNCMSLHKVATALGEKTQIHQSSCNQDTSCLVGDCPAFVTVTGTTGVRKRLPPPVTQALPPPATAVRLDRPYHVYTPGVGGTGVLTLNAVLAQAAALDGKRVLSYDQTGAAQKWGAVLSSLVLADPDVPLHSNKVGLGRADLYLALDLMAAADATNLDRCDAERTVAVVNTSLLPSGEMIRDVHFPASAAAMRAAIGRFTRDAVEIDARDVAERLFDDYLMTNVVALGAAFQAGFIPVSEASIETAIRLNGAAVEANVLAFRYGRLAVADPGALATLLAAQRLTLADRLADGTSLAADLADYHDAAYAAQYTAFVNEVAEREQAVLPGSTAIAAAVARGLHKLMAYKDEYEVARLHVQGAFRANAAARFAGSPRLAYNFHPPLLRALGMKRKLQLGAWFTPVLQLLVRLRRLRGTRLDPFGAAEVRRVERALIPWYRDAVTQALAKLTPANAAQVVVIASAPDEIRGYEELKLRSAAATKARVGAMLERL
jgi:indolepyruvate ferredoxin oxidoreductase